MPHTSSGPPPFAALLLSLLLLGLLLTAPARAQQEGLLQLDSPLDRFLLHQQAAGHLPGAFLSHRPLSAYAAQRLLDTLAARREALTPTSRRLLDQFRGAAPGPGVDFVQERLPFLYRDGSSLFSAQGADFGLEVEPLLTFSYGRARQTERDGRDAVVPVWQNTRGIRIGGHVGPHLFFETRLEENQRRDVRTDAFAQKTAPRLNRVILNDAGTTYDYLLATGVVGFRAEHFEVRLGRGRNAWGPGRTSLLLSDYAPVYDQLQLRTSFWRIQYTNLFTQMEDLTPLPARYGNQPIPRKYGAFHRLALTLPGQVELGLFESVIFAPDIAGGARNDFDLSYLNPIVFYRAVERDRGSPDNVLLGLDLSWVARPSLQLYTQFMLDELVVSELGDATWRNKWGWLAGAHLVNWPLENLSLRLEYARLRPFLYSHRTGTTSYTHYNDLLGHPAGPNAQDIALFAAYQLTPRLYGALSVAYTERGRGAGAENVGADPLKPYNARRSDRATLLQGVQQANWLIEAHAGYELLPRLFVEAALRAQSTDDALRGLDRYAAPFVSLRWGLPFRSERY